ncbi:MAG: DUF5798 family protein [Halobacteriales archaeon]
MGLGGTAKKLQKVVDMADELYSKLGEMRQQLIDIRETIERTDDRVDSLESEMAAQRKLLEAIAEANDVDVSEEPTDGDESVGESVESAPDAVESDE